MAMIVHPSERRRTASATRLRAAAARGPHVVAGREIADEVVRRVVERVLDASERSRRARLDEVVQETIYAEQSRLEREDPDPRSEADRAFCAWLRHELTHADEPRQRELVRMIVERYADEISGHFDRKVYGVATRVVPAALGALLHGLVPRRALEGAHVFDVEDRVLLGGEIDALQSLARVGTVILAPTHVSNLDALLVGYAIHRLGLPPFAYGAGLNLFSSASIGYFMRNLGAYTVDRKKTDPLYRGTLKEYATVLLERGQHSLFFPGGTRSRSGAVESRLKKGLLGTAPVAFRRALEESVARPRVFVVPCTITYPLVLEAATLVDDYLRAEGGPHYVDVHDEFERPWRWLDFLRGLFELDLRIHVRLGRPLDPVGNEVDDRGASHDPRGKVVDPSRYLFIDGRPARDDARDAEYTRTLAARLAAAYRRDTVALPTSVVAFAIFERLRRERAQPDLFRLLRGLGTELGVAIDDVREDVARAIAELEAAEARGDIRLADELRGARAADVVDQAVDTFGTYHPTAVVMRRGHVLQVGDANLLFYYRNRLEHAGLLGARPLLPAEAPAQHPWRAW